MSNISNQELQQIKQRLLNRKRELGELADTANQASEIVELDQTRQGRLSRMDALQGQAMSKAMQQRRQLQLQQIDSALKRIEDNEYGYCLRCEEPIASQRLKNDPSVTLCIHCAE